MKFYSEYTKRLYDSPEDCEKAESAIKDAELKKEKEKAQRVAERKAKADEVSKAYDSYVSARRAYEKVLTEFCEKYGAYHTSIDSSTLKDLMKYFDL